MRLLVIADAFPPQRTSAAVQLRDLVLALAHQRHEVTVCVPTHEFPPDIRGSGPQNVDVHYLQVPKFKDVGYVRRTLSELAMPYAMLRSISKTPLAGQVWDGVIWYSPTIFLYPLAATMKRRSGCKSYLIVRDIFPEWAVDMGLMGRSLPYHFFRWIARRQYRAADTIGVQSPGNLAYFPVQKRHPGQRVEVLHNWLADAPESACSLRLDDTPLAGRRIFVYAGNMGVAQGMDAILDLASSLNDRSDIGFLLIGRGSEVTRLRHVADSRSLSNLMFHDEIASAEISTLYRQCHVGLVALDPRHKTHNIPGKFISYAHAGMPVFAVVNQGNDLVELIHSERIGIATSDRSPAALRVAALQLLDAMQRDPHGMTLRSRLLAQKLFTAERAAEQIVAALTRQPKCNALL
jgi:glycosyltransferase involved in cell wall biosynthesis